MGSAPYLGGGFGHFYAYAPTKIEYAIDRFAMEVKRQLDVLDRRLADNRVPRRRRLHHRRHRRLALVRRPGEGPALRRRPSSCRCRTTSNVQRWADAIASRPAVQARAHGQPRSRRAFQPVARAPRRQRFRHEDAGQARAGGLNSARLSRLRAGAPSRPRKRASMRTPLKVRGERQPPRARPDVMTSSVAEAFLNSHRRRHHGILLISGSTTIVWCR